MPLEALAVLALVSSSGQRSSACELARRLSVDDPDEVKKFNLRNQMVLINGFYI